MICDARDKEKAHPQQLSAESAQSYEQHIFISYNVSGEGRFSVFTFISYSPSLIKLKQSPFTS